MAALQRRASPMFDVLRNYICAHPEALKRYPTITSVANHSTATSPSFYFLESTAAHKSDFRFLRDFNSNVSSHCAELDAAAKSGIEAGDANRTESLAVLPESDYFNLNNNRDATTERESGDAVKVTAVEVATGSSASSVVGSFRKMNSSVISKMRKSMKMDSIDMSDNYIVKLAKKANVAREGSRLKFAAENRFYQLYRGYGLDISRKVMSLKPSSPVTPPTPAPDVKEIRVMDAVTAAIRSNSNRNQNAATGNLSNRNQNAATGNPYGGILDGFRNTKVVVPPAPAIKGEALSRCAQTPKASECAPTSQPSCSSAEASSSSGQASGNPYHGMIQGSGGSPCGPSKPSCPPPPKKDCKPAKPACSAPKKPACSPKSACSPPKPAEVKCEPVVKESAAACGEMKAAGSPCGPASPPSQSACAPSKSACPSTKSACGGSSAPQSFDSHVPRRVGKTHEIGRQSASFTARPSSRSPTSIRSLSPGTISLSKIATGDGPKVESAPRNKSLPRQDQQEPCRKVLRPIKANFSDTRLSASQSSPGRLPVPPLVPPIVPAPQGPSAPTTLRAKQMPVFRAQEQQKPPPLKGKKNRN